MDIEDLDWVAIEMSDDESLRIVGSYRCHRCGGKLTIEDEGEEPCTEGYIYAIELTCTKCGRQYRVEDLYTYASREVFIKEE